MNLLALILIALVMGLFLFAALLIVRGGTHLDAESELLLSRYEALDQRDFCRQPTQQQDMVSESSLKAICAVLSEEKR